MREEYTDSPKPATYVYASSVVSCSSSEAGRQQGFDLMEAAWAKEGIRASRTRTRTTAIATGFASLYKSLKVICSPTFTDSLSRCWRSF